MISYIFILPLKKLKISVHSCCLCCCIETINNHVVNKQVSCSDPEYILPYLLSFIQVWGHQKLQNKIHPDPKLPLISNLRTFNTFYLWPYYIYFNLFKHFVGEFLRPDCFQVFLWVRSGSGFFLRVRPFDPVYLNPDPQAWFEATIMYLYSLLMML